MITNKPSGRLILVSCCTLLFAATALSCGGKDECKKSGPACTELSMPSVAPGQAFASVAGLKGGDSFHAYGTGNAVWRTDGKGISIYLKDPFYTKDLPRPISISLDLFKDQDGDSPSCYVRDASFPLCFSLGDREGGIATIEDNKDSGLEIYVTEDSATGTVELLGYDDNGMLAGRFEFTAFLSGTGASQDSSLEVFVKDGVFAVSRAK